MLFKIVKFIKSWLLSNYSGADGLRSSASRTRSVLKQDRLKWQV
jgi:hypothetical protein